MRANPPARELAAASLFYAFAAAVFTWPLAMRLNSGLPDLWDAKLNAWILHWDFHQTFRNPMHLFDANIFYPARYALAFSENLYGAALFGFPLYAAGASTLFVYNVLFLLGMWLSAMAAWALARESTGDGVSALIAGIVYAFVPWRLAQLPHIQFQWGAFLALALLFLLRYLEGGRRRDAVLFSACFAWNALSNVHYAIFSGLLVLLVVLHETLAGGWKAMRVRVLGTGAGVTAAAVAVLPFYVPYQMASELYGMRRGWSEIETFSGRPIDFLTAGPQNKLYAPLTQKLAQPEGDFFPGLSVMALGVIAAALLWARRPEPSVRHGSPESPGRQRLVRALDGVVAVQLLLWLAAMLKPNLSIGPLHLGDAGRILVLATPPLALRLALAFPRASRFADLGDFLRRRWRDRRASLYVLVLALGVVVALGVHTPYYRFLALSFGAIFRAIRVPSRGIVLFDLALGVLAAWGLALVTSRLSRAGRLAAAAAAIVAVGFEYRAFPIEIGDVKPEPPPVYRWLAAAPFSGAIVHWPLSTDPDVEHTFRSTAHWKPVVNGYSGFGPPAYQELVELLAQKPIPEGIWARMEEAGASVLVFHPLEIEDADARLAYVRALREGVRSEKAVALRGFGDGPARDFVFRLAGAAPFDAGVPAGGGPAAADEVRRELSYFESILNAPFGFIDSPKEGEVVAPGAWGFGWALDDSGIREVRIAVDGKPASSALYGSARPGPAEAYPAFPDAAKAGFGFAVPALPPGPHELVFTLIAKDGGKTQIVRKIVVH
jgi:hypothetical protein